MIGKLRTRVVNMVSRALLSRLDDSRPMQSAQVDLGDDETRTLERVQNYGFTSVPLDGAEAVVVFVGGRRDHGYAVAVDDRRYRLKDLQAGEVAVYTDQGDSIVFRRGGTLEVSAATKVVIDAPIVELTGNTQAAVNGTAYRAAEDTFLAAIVVAVSAALTGLGLGAAAATLTAAQAAFNAASATYLSTKVKL